MDPNQYFNLSSLLGGLPNIFNSLGSIYQQPSWTNSFTVNPYGVDAFNLGASNAQNMGLYRSPGYSAFDSGYTPSALTGINSLAGPMDFSYGSSPSTYGSSLSSLLAQMGVPTDYRQNYGGGQMNSSILAGLLPVNTNATPSTGQQGQMPTFNIYNTAAGGSNYDYDYNTMSSGGPGGTSQMSTSTPPSQSSTGTSSMSTGPLPTQTGGGGSSMSTGTLPQQTVTPGGSQMTTYPYGTGSQMTTYPYGSGSQMTTYPSGSGSQLTTYPYGGQMTGLSPLNPQVQNPLTGQWTPYQPTGNSQLTYWPSPGGSVSPLNPQIQNPLTGQWEPYNPGSGGDSQLTTGLPQLPPNSGPQLPDNATPPNSGPQLPGNNWSDTGSMWDFTPGASNAGYVPPGGLSGGFSQLPGGYFDPGSGQYYPTLGSQPSPFTGLDPNAPYLPGGFAPGASGGLNLQADNNLTPFQGGYADPSTGAFFPSTQTSTPTTRGQGGGMPPYSQSPLTSALPPVSTGYGYPQTYGAPQGYSNPAYTPAPVGGGYMTPPLGGGYGQQPTYPQGYGTPQGYGGQSYGSPYGSQQPYLPGGSPELAGTSSAYNPQSSGQGYSGPYWVGGYGEGGTSMSPLSGGGWSINGQPASSDRRSAGSGTGYSQGYGGQAYGGSGNAQGWANNPSNGYLIPGMGGGLGGYSPPMGGGGQGLGGTSDYSAGSGNAQGWANNPSHGALIPSLNTGGGQGQGYAQPLGGPVRSQPQSYSQPGYGSPQGGQPGYGSTPQGGGQQQARPGYGRPTPQRFGGGYALSHLRGAGSSNSFQNSGPRPPEDSSSSQGGQPQGGGPLTPGGGGPQLRGGPQSMGERIQGMYQADMNQAVQQESRSAQQNGAVKRPAQRSNDRRPGAVAGGIMGSPQMLR